MYFSKLLVSDIVAFAQSRGVDIEDLVKSCGIESDQEIKPDDVIGYEQMAEILNKTGQVINDEFLGLHLGESILLKGTQQVDEIMQNSPTIEEAFNNAVNYSKLISDALSCHLSKSDNYAKIVFEINPNWAVYPNHTVQQIIDLTLVCTFKSIYWLTGMKYTPFEVHLSNPNIKKRNEYFRLFDCSVKFNQESIGIIFHNPILDQAVPNHNISLLANLKELRDKEMNKLESEEPFVVDIKNIILKNLPQKTLIHQVSKDLHLSERTLQRKLSQHGTNYKQIERDLLIRLAKKLILFEQRSMDEISYLLGFSEASSFLRFFKNATNTTPRNFKQDSIEQ